MQTDSRPPQGPPPRIEPPPRIVVPINRRRWWIHFILVGGYILLVGVLGREHSEGRTHMPALSHSAGGLLLVSALELLVFALLLGLALLASRASCDDLLLRWRPGFWAVPLGIGYSVALRFAVAFVMMVIGVGLVITRTMTGPALQEFLTTHRPNLQALVDVSAMRQNPLYYWLTLTVVSFVVAGVREELWRAAFLAGLRKLWPQQFGSRAGQVAAVAIAAVVFGFGHLGLGLLAMVFAGLLGFGLGLIMIFHRSVWPAVIAHGMFDATSLALLPWLAEKLPEIQRTLGH